MKRRTQLMALLAGVLAAGGLAGCSALAPKAYTSNFYLLSPVPEKSAPNPAPQPDLEIGVFSPDLPSYLDRPQMVLRLANNQISIQEYQRWGDSLAANFGRVFVQDVSILSGSPRVALFPLTRAFTHEFEIYMLIYQFDGTPGGEVTLRVRWRLTGTNGKPELLAKETSYTRTASLTPDPYAGYVATLSGLVGDFAKDVVATIPEVRAAAAAKKAADEQAAAAAKVLQDAAQLPKAATSATPQAPILAPIPGVP